MNITKSIAEEIGGDIEILIKQNNEIQFYAIPDHYSYIWRDTRFKKSSNEWENTRAKTRKSLISIFKRHLKKINNI